MPTSMLLHFLTLKNKTTVGGVPVQNHLKRDFPWKYNTIYSGCSFPFSSLVQ